MHRIAIAVPAALAVTAAAAGCASSMFFNQSFLASEELRIAQSGYVSLKTTGETFDFSGIRAQEPGGKNVVLIKVHGTYLATGDGFMKVWKVWPACGRDKAKYKAIKLEPGPSGFRSPAFEKADNCALLRWQSDSGPRQAYIDSDGDADESKCDD